MKKSFELASSANRALLGAISGNIKAIIVYVDDNKVLNLEAYFYSKPSEQDAEDLKVVESEISADFADDEIIEFRDKFMVWDGKERLNLKDNLVYLRKD